MILNKQTPKNHETRLVKRFAILPIYVEGNVIWLQTYWSGEIAHVNSRRWFWWEEARYLTKPDHTPTYSEMAYD